MPPSDAHKGPPNKQINQLDGYTSDQHSSDESSSGGGNIYHYNTSKEDLYDDYTCDEDSSDYHESQTGSSRPGTSENYIPAAVTGSSRDTGHLFNTMGSELVDLYVGPERVKFTIHKGLLLSSGEIFSHMYPPERKETEHVLVTKEQPEIVKMFVNILYTQSFPRVVDAMGALEKGKLMQDLCKLYSFVDRFRIEPEICNKVMDAIQDGFRLLDKLPDPYLISSVYKNTDLSSRIRHFCVACVLFKLHSGNISEEEIVALFEGNKEMLADFLLMIKCMGNGHRDPRIRDGEGDPKYVECWRNRDGSFSDPIRNPGVWPCLYHVHRIVKFVDGDENGRKEIVEGKPCYLWAA